MLARRDEGLMFPDRPPLKGMPRINAFPGKDAQRKALHVKPVKKIKPFAPTVRKVKEICRTSSWRNSSRWPDRAAQPCAAVP